MSTVVETIGGKPAVQPMAAACVTSAWDCQVYSFFGSPETVTENLVSLPSQLVQRRVYMLAIEGAGRAEVRLFERGSLDDPEGTVAAWHGETLDGLVTRVTESLVANRGVHCPGEQVGAVVYQDREMETQGPVPVPVSPRAAFGHSLKSFDARDFVQASVIVLC